jgi:SAM-dependent methyltransferase
MSNRQDVPGYLLPYVAAGRKHGAGFGALLWASPATQRKRFDALVRIADPSGLTLLDAGCGRADLWHHLIRNGRPPARYVGVEVMPQLADAARADVPADIITADFIADPAVLDVGADMIYFGGSLNTVPPAVMRSTIEQGCRHAPRVVFNFLCSPERAMAQHLYHHSKFELLTFAAGLGRAMLLDDYLPGDATIRIARGSDDFGHDHTSGIGDGNADKFAS